MTEVVFEDGVDAFGLTVGLRMVRRGKLEVGAESGLERLPEGGDEYGASVRDDGLGRAVEAEDVVDEEGGESGSVEFGRGRNKMGLFSKTVHHDPNTVEAMRKRQTGNEVH